MSSAGSRLWPTYFYERGVPQGNGRFETWIVRASYVAKSRKTPAERAAYETYIMSVVEDAVRRGHFASQNWEKVSMLPPSDFKVDPSKPCLLSTSPAGTNIFAAPSTSTAARASAAANPVSRRDDPLEVEARRAMYSEARKVCTTQAHIDVLNDILTKELDVQFVAGALSFRQLPKQALADRVLSVIRGRTGATYAAPHPFSTAPAPLQQPQPHAQHVPGAPRHLPPAANAYTTAISPTKVHVPTYTSISPTALVAAPTGAAASSKRPRGLEAPTYSADILATQRRRNDPFASYETGESYFGPTGGGKAVALTKRDAAAVDILVDTTKSFFAELVAAGDEGFGHSSSSSDDDDDVASKRAVAQKKRREPSGAVVGTSEELERDYSRDEPSPHELRPLPVLIRAFSHVCLRARSDFPADSDIGLQYLSKQLKGLRQDLLVQNIRNPFAVSVYERHARLCLKLGDLSDFQGCQAALKGFYRHGLHSELGNNIEEFTSYRLVYLALREKTEDLDREITDLEMGRGVKPLHRAHIARLKAMGVPPALIASAIGDEAARRLHVERPPPVIKIVDGVQVIVEEEDAEALRNLGIDVDLGDGTSKKKEKQPHDLLGRPITVGRYDVDETGELILSAAPAPTAATATPAAAAAPPGGRAAGKHSSSKAAAASAAAAAATAAASSFTEDDALRMHFDVVQTHRDLLKRPNMQRVLQLCAAIENKDSRKVVSLVVALGCYPMLEDLVSIFLQRLRIQWLTSMLPGLKGALPSWYVLEALGFAPVALLPGAKLNPKAATTRTRILDQPRSSAMSKRAMHAEIDACPAGYSFIDGSIMSSEAAFRKLLEVLKLKWPYGLDFPTAVQPKSVHEMNELNEDPTAVAMLTHSLERLRCASTIDSKELMDAIVGYNTFLTTRNDAAGVGRQE